MKNRMVRSIALLGISVMMTLSVAAQDQPKVKVSDKEVKYKSEDVKIKEKKEETKYKSADVKVKEKEGETKIKAANVKPMQRTSTERSTLKTGETRVRTQEQLKPLPVEKEAVEATPAPQVAVPDLPKVKKTTTRKYAARKTTVQKPTVAHKTNAAPRTIVRTKVVRDTVIVASPPEKVVSTEYVHDTVTVTRVDTVEKVKTRNTYNGYDVPRGDFKKVKLKRDPKTGEVEMKRKEKDGKTEKLKQ
jgi:hypothetical protein